MIPKRVRVDPPSPPPILALEVQTLRLESDETDVVPSSPSPQKQWIEQALANESMVNNLKLANWFAKKYTLPVDWAWLEEHDDDLALHSMSLPMEQLAWTQILWEKNWALCGQVDSQEIKLNFLTNVMATSKKRAKDLEGKLQ